MNPTLLALVLSAAGIAFVHTFAPDHWMPFAALARAQRWSRTRLVAVTLVAGLGHVGASIVVGLAGLWLGWALNAIQWMQSYRGAASLYVLMAFGVVYAGWGMFRARRWKDAHGHDHAVHTHHHGHHHHHHSPAENVNDARISAWTLFVVFVLGPCEALVPVMFAGFQVGSVGVLSVTAAFSVVTLVTMTALTLMAYAGFRLIRHELLERHVHALTGATITATAAAVMWLGV